MSKGDVQAAVENNKRDKNGTVKLKARFLTLLSSQQKKLVFCPNQILTPLVKADLIEKTNISQYQHRPYDFRRSS